jgi:hypothetical protein
MKRVVGVLCCALLASCAPGSESRVGQVFCQLQLAGGGTAIVGLIDLEASALAPAETPVVVAASGLDKTMIDNLCACAGRRAGANAVAVAAPADPADTGQMGVVVSSVRR